MHAIISEIDYQSSQKVSNIWQNLCESCGLEAIFNIPTPHFTWLIAQEFEIDAVDLKLSAIIDSCPKVKTHTFGFGVFSGRNPVLHLPMVKSLEMIHFHQKIWDQIQPFCRELNLYYSPKMWLPHITLALKDLNVSNILCAVDVLAGESLELSVTMTSLAIAELEDDNIGQLLKQYPVDV